MTRTVQSHSDTVQVGKPEGEAGSGTPPAYILTEGRREGASASAGARARATSKRVTWEHGAGAGAGLRPEAVGVLLLLYPAHLLYLALAFPVSAPTCTGYFPITSSALARSS